MDDSDYNEAFLEVAFQQAREALESGEVPIGCCFVMEDQVVAVGRNEVNLTKVNIWSCFYSWKFESLFKNATRHAEMVAIDRFLMNHDKEKLSECTVYVNVEPCIMCARWETDQSQLSIVSQWPITDQYWPIRTQHHNNIDQSPISICFQCSETV